MTDTQRSQDETCDLCDGAVVFIVDNPKSPMHNHTTICWKCEEGRRLRSKRVATFRKRCGLPHHLKALTLETFEALPELSPSQQIALSVARQIVRSGAVESRGQSRRGLFLHGDVGLGKSGLAAGIVNAVVDTVTPARYAAVPDVLDHLKATFAPGSDVEFDQLFNTYKNVPLLVLDDLGTENPTTWALEKLYQIIDARYQNGRVTVVTSNLSLREMLAHFEQRDNWMGKRIVDRLKAMCAVVHIQGRNLRE